MTKRYEFTGETKDYNGRTLQRIRALVAIGPYVMPGDIGGWIESESNLPQTGTGWIYGEAIACGQSTIRGGTIEGGTIWGGTIRGGTIWGGTIRGGTIWGGTIRGGTIWGGTIWGGTTTQKQLIFLAGLEWDVTITDTHMTIGCQHHALGEWWNFNTREIAAMDRGAPKFWKTHKATLRAICDATGR